MTTRVSPAEVKLIIETDKSDSVIQAFIDSAEVLVDNYLEGKGLSDELLKEIEKWVSAHLLSVLSPSVTREKIGPAEIEYATFQSNKGQGLLSTMYGLTAITLDSSKTLVNIGLKKAEIYVMPSGDSYS